MPYHRVARFHEPVVSEHHPVVPVHPVAAGEVHREWCCIQHLVCLPWEAETGLRWAELLARLRASGRAMPIKGSLITATALVQPQAFASLDPAPAA